MSRLKTEDEIIAKWTGDITKPLVSICCLTYNHEKYIKDAINGFLSQETDFPFEVIIHDDASTDGTASIVRDYMSLYPNIIRAILQDENILSKGINPMVKHLLPAARGEFVALCEGDDYWLDIDKIKKQVEVLKKRSKYKLTYTDAIKKNERTGGEKSFVKWPFSWMPMAYVLIRGGGSMPTATLLFRACCIKNILELHEIGAEVDDFKIQVLCAYPFGALGLKDRTAVYRKFSDGSISVRRLDMSKRLKLCQQKLQRYDDLDKVANISKLHLAVAKARFYIINFLLFLKYGQVKSAYQLISLRARRRNP